MKRILVVDDETDIAEAIKAVLEMEDYRVETARNGRECLAYLSAGKPDLILLDVMMPGMDGFEVLERMQTEGYNVPVVMMSAVQPGRSLSRYGLKTFMRKPFTLDSLLESVEQALRNH